MEIVKVLEILNNHIIKLEEENQFKDWEIERLNEKLKSIEEYIESYGGNYEKV
jgi:hypothetical protein